MAAKDESEKKGGETGANTEVERLRINRAFWLSAYGLTLAVMLVFFLVLMGFKTSSDVTSIVGLFTSVLGTLVGAFFGLQIGSAGKEQAEERASDAEKKAGALQSAADPKTLKKAQELYPNMFK